MRKSLIAWSAATVFALAPAFAFAADSSAATAAPLPPAGPAGSGASKVVDSEAGVSWAWVGIAGALLIGAVAIGLSGGGHGSSSSPTQTAH
jgi:hypothetical protein